jgi:DNA-binding NtrC family response regulator
MNTHNSIKTGNKKASTIMIVDDDLDLVTLFKIALRKHGYEVFDCTDPFLALEYFKKNYDIYNVVISDLRMPGMDGFEFLKNIKLINPKTKVLLMSAFDTSGDTEFARYKENSVIDGFIQKPMSIEKLYSLVNSHLKRKAK